MPRRDGTGPMGRGSRTGTGMGFCNTTKAAGILGGLGLGLGLGWRRCGRGFGWNNYGNAITPQNQKDLLNEEKAILEERLKSINDQLNTLQNDN